MKFQILQSLERKASTTVPIGKVRCIKVLGQPRIHLMEKAGVGMCQTTWSISFR